MKATLSTLESLIIMDSPEVEGPAAKSTRLPPPKGPAADLDDTEEDKLAEMLAAERAALTLQDETLKDIWSRAHANSDQAG